MYIFVDITLARTVGTAIRYSSYFNTIYKTPFDLKKHGAASKRVKTWLRLPFHSSLDTSTPFDMS